MVKLTVRTNTELIDSINGMSIIKTAASRPLVQSIKQVGHKISEYALFVVNTRRVRHNKAKIYPAQENDSHTDAFVYVPVSCSPTQKSWEASLINLCKSQASAQTLTESIARIIKLMEFIKCHTHKVVIDQVLLNALIDKTFDFIEGLNQLHIPNALQRQALEHVVDFHKCLRTAGVTSFWVKHNRVFNSVPSTYVLSKCESI